MNEKEMEDRLVENLNSIESGLILIERQKKVDTGIVDLFCIDKRGNYVIVEVKIKPDAKVITQLAKYNMGLIKGGISKNRLRTILVACELPKKVKELCEFFNFEIKNIYKERIRNIKEAGNNKFKFPSGEELIMFIKKRDFVNFSDIARFYKLNHATVFDVVNCLLLKKLVKVKKIGANKIVLLAKGDKHE